MNTTLSLAEPGRDGALACLALMLLMLAVPVRPLSAQDPSPGDDPAPVLSDPSWSPERGFSCRVTGKAGMIYELQVSSDSEHWATLSQFLLAESGQEVRAPMAANHERLFYRVVGPVTEESAAISLLWPGSASPGMPVRLSVRESLFEEELRARVEVDGVFADVRWLGSATEIEFVTPLRPAGDVQVQLHEPGKLPGPPAAFRILRTRHQHLIFSLNADGVALMRHGPYAGNRNLPAPPDVVRLSLDLFNDAGGYVATTSVPHPMRSRFEVFGEDEKGVGAMHHGTAPDGDAFAVQVPNIPGAFRVRVYEAAPGLDLTTAAGRAKRELLNEIVVNP